jgi:hypothetical protein
MLRINDVHDFTSPTRFDRMHGEGSFSFNAGSMLSNGLHRRDPRVPLHTASEFGPVNEGGKKKFISQESFLPLASCLPMSDLFER